MARVRVGAVMVIAAAALSGAGWAQGADTIASGNLEWKQIVPGVSFAASYGDWEKGAHGKFVRIDRGAQVPMHVHSNEYHAVIVSGQMVNLFEAGQKAQVSAGDYFYVAAKRPHSHECLSDEGCLFYTYGDGLWDIEVIDGGD